MDEKELQIQVADFLRKEDYCAEFAVGYDEAVRIISAYLGAPRRREVEF